VGPARRSDARHRRSSTTGRDARRTRGDPRTAGPRLRRRVLRSHQGRPHRGAAVRTRTARPRRTSRRRTSRFTADRRADDGRGDRSRRGISEHPSARPQAPGRRHRPDPRLGGGCVRRCPHRRRRRVAPAVHVRLDPTPGRCRAHAPCGRYQPDPDDPLDRPAQSKHRRRSSVGRSDGSTRCPPSRGTAASSPPHPTSPTSGPRSAGDLRLGTTST
jgi:hypothetical protein